VSQRSRGTLAEDRSVLHRETLRRIWIAPPGKQSSVALAAGTGGLIGHYWHNIPKDDGALEAAFEQEAA